MVSKYVFITIRAASLAGVIPAKSRAQSLAAVVGVSQLPQSVAVNQVTNKIYVGSTVNYGAGSIALIDGDTNITAATLPQGTFAYGGNIVNPITNKVYAVGGGGIIVTDGATNGITTMPKGVAQLLVNPVTNKIYGLGGSLIVLDGPTNTTTSTPDRKSSLAASEDK